MSEGVCVYAHTYVQCVFLWVHMCMLEQVESRGRLGYHSSGSTPFVFFKMGSFIGLQLTK